MAAVAIIVFVTSQKMAVCRALLVYDRDQMRILWKRFHILSSSIGALNFLIKLVTMHTTDGKFNIMVIHVPLYFTLKYFLETDTMLDVRMSALSLKKLSSFATAFCAHTLTVLLSCIL